LTLRLSGILETGRAAKPMLLVVTYRVATLLDAARDRWRMQDAGRWPIPLMLLCDACLPGREATTMRVALEGATGSAGRTESTSESLHALVVASSSA
jgi:hypothetical protein